MSAKKFLNFTIKQCRKYSQHANKDLVCEHLKGDHTGILTFGLNRPEQKNAMSMSLLQNLTKAVDKIPFDNDVKVLIIHSLVPGAFCAGIVFLSTDRICYALSNLKF